MLFFSDERMIMSLSRQSRAYVFGLTSVLIWSTVASAFKLTLRHMDHVQLLAYATVTSTCVLLGILVVQKKLGQLAVLGPRDILVSMGMGLLNPLLYYLILFKAYDLLPAQEAQALNYSWAITMTLLSIPLLGQRVGRRQFAAIMISYLGVLVIATRGHVLSLEFSDPLGTGLALSSTIIWALYWILNTRDRLDPGVRLFVNFCFGTVYILIYTPLASSFSVDSLAGIAGAVYVGIFEMGITFVFWLMALKYSSSAGRISHLIYLSPIVSLGLIKILVGEPILNSTLAGLVLILGGVALQGKAAAE
jgi:drug/metabolite transporter (DMT)-like permease